MSKSSRKKTHSVLRPLQRKELGEAIMQGLVMQEANRRMAEPFREIAARVGPFTPANKV